MLLNPENKISVKEINNPDYIPVMETFYSIQGEGFNVGKPATFIRLAGCDVGCVWCDVKESWEVSNNQVININDLVDEALSHPCKNIVITGGEPCMYNLNNLTSILHKNGFQLWLETSGAYPLSGEFDWICVSPKKFKKPLDEVLLHADELKIVVFNKSDFEWAEEHAKMVSPECKLFLQPEWDKRDSMSPLIIDYAKENSQWNISLQIHKYLNIR